ncbi:FecR protein [Stieleria maiorica]|uniref:FecR protein n=1 Tax=Stieleria maiorica TaxID=2795974 RepID=A0A5B9MTJ1_9BACT|nr:LamG-like jellyroll fold domain-containing protein [Stieleria maiorica]QEG02398.1 FecR protein [Stieleria maiorica]
MLKADELIDRILEGDASEEDAKDFQAWLQVPGNLEQFSLRAELHADLRRSLRRRYIQNRALESDADGTVTDSASSPVNHPATVVLSRQVLRLTVAGIATAACVFIALLWYRRDGLPTSEDAFAATVVSNVNGVLTAEGSQWNEKLIPTGDYELQQGLLNLQFGGGVMVYVEAPARFAVVNHKRVILHGGRMSAKVPPEGIGFTVETPEAEVVDFGTEFSVDVEGGASEVHVFDGLVRVHPGASKQRDVSRTIDLQASQAVRISNGFTEPEGISVAFDRFVRNFDEPRLNYARAIKQLSPLVYYRMPIRDRGLVAQPPQYSGVVLTGEGKRPPHACGVFIGGSLRVGVDSTGRGGRVDSPPTLSTGKFSLTVFVYLENPARQAVVVTNFDGKRGNFGLSLSSQGILEFTLRSDVARNTVLGTSVLPLQTWRHVAATADGNHLHLYEDGKLVDSTPCVDMAVSDSETLWFGTDANSTRAWNGRIDEVAMFDRALTDEEVAALYLTAQEEIARSQ